MRLNLLLLLLLFGACVPAAQGIFGWSGLIGSLDDNTTSHDHHHHDHHALGHDHAHSHDHTHDHGGEKDTEHDHNHSHDQPHDHSHDHDQPHDHSHDHGQPHDHTHSHDQPNDHSHSHDQPHDHSHDHSQPHDHSHDHDQPHDHSHDHDEGDYPTHDLAPKKPFTHDTEPRLLHLLLPNPSHLQSNHDHSYDQPSHVHTQYDPRQGNNDRNNDMMPKGFNQKIDKNYNSGAMHLNGQHNTHYYVYNHHYPNDDRSDDHFPRHDLRHDPRSFFFRKPHHFLTHPFKGHKHTHSHGFSDLKRDHDHDSYDPSQGRHDHMSPHHHRHHHHHGRMSRFHHHSHDPHSHHHSHDPHSHHHNDHHKHRDHDQMRPSHHDHGQRMFHDFRCGERHHSHKHHHHQDHHDHDDHSPFPDPTPSCPMLYTRVGDRCIAFFSVAKMPWTAAREFCSGIFGNLLTFSTINQYLDLVTYLQDTEMAVEMWVGGRLEVDGLKRERWMWVDGSDMPAGTPYWLARREYYGGLVQAPQDPDLHNSQEAWCASIGPDTGYYLDSSECFSYRSPVCVLRDDVTLIMVEGGVYSYPAFNMTTSTPPLTPSPYPAEPEEEEKEEEESNRPESSNEEKEEEKEEGDSSGKDAEGSGEIEGSGFGVSDWSDISDMFIDQE